MLGGIGPNIGRTLTMFI